MKSLLFSALLAAPAISAATIGIDLGNGERVEVEDVAGLVPASNWNNPTGFPLFTDAALVDSSNNATGATATVIGFNGNFGSLVAVSGTDPNTEMFNRGIRMPNTFNTQNPTGVATLSVSGLSASTYPSYDVIFYLAAASGIATPPATYSFTAAINGGTAETFLISGDTANYTGSFVAATDTTAGNYIIFSGVTGSSFTVTFDAAANTSILVTGAQIVPIPEPAAATLGAAALALGLIRRRRH